MCNDRNGNLNPDQKEKVKKLLNKVRGGLFVSPLKNEDEENLLSSLMEEQSKEAKNAFVELESLLN